MSFKQALRLGCVLALIMPGFAAQAADVYDLPQGCTALATVQSRDCSVSHLFTCAERPNHNYRADFTDDGQVFYNIVDHEARWIYSDHIASGHQDHLDTETDPASMTELLESGVDSFDFTTTSEQVGTVRYVGYDRLTGTERVIDGQRLLETDFQMRALDAEGQMLWSVQGQEYVHPEWRIFLSGTRQVTADGDTWSEDGAPMRFALPDEPGHLRNTPMFGCGEMLASFRP